MFEPHFPLLNHLLKVQSLKFSPFYHLHRSKRRDTISVILHVLQLVSTTSLGVDCLGKYHQGIPVDQRSTRSKVWQSQHTNEDLWLGVESGLGIGLWLAP